MIKKEKEKKKEVSIEKSSLWIIIGFFYEELQLQHMTSFIAKFEYCNNVLAKFNCLLLKYSDICYHFQKFLIS